MRQAWRFLVALMLLSSMCQACSLIEGYFHQVTLIRGTVVGSSWIPFRWARQSVSVGDATLTLFEYRSAARLEELKRVAVVKADRKGRFDFGTIPKGHYSLAIQVSGSDRMGGWFDVEITDSVKATKSITIDVSPIHIGLHGRTRVHRDEILSGMSFERARL